MPSHYYDDEYKGSEHATDVFRAPKKEKTAGQKLEESGEFMPDAEQEDLSQQVNYSTMEDIYARERRPGFDREMEAIGKAKRAGNLTDQERIEAHKRAKRIRDAEDEIDPETGWPMYLAKGAWWLMQKVGEGFDWVDDQAGIPGTDIDVYHARRKILDPLSETHLALGILGEIFLPDSIDIATAGFSYIPNRFRKAGKVGIKLWADITKARKGAEFKTAKVDWDKGLEFAAKAQGRPYDMKYLNEEGIIHSIRVDPEDLNPKQSELFSKGGIRGGSYDHFKFKDDGWMVGPDSRDVLEAYMTGNNTYVPRFFESQKRLLKPQFLDEYGDYMLRNNLVSQEDLARGVVGHNIELHHITPLKASAPLYHNTKHGDEGWQVVTDIFREYDLFPGQGIPSGLDNVNRTNYMYALKEPHNILHNQFLKDLLGKDGSKFFTDSRMELIQSGTWGRRFVAIEYANIIRHGKAVLEDAMRQMKGFFSKSGIPQDELIEYLNKASASGEIKILDTDLLLESVSKQQRSIIDQVSTEPFGSMYGDEVPEVLQKHINDGLQSLFQRTQKLYGRFGKGGLDKPPVNPYE